MSNRAVLLLAHGSPESVEDIPEFLKHVREGRPTPEPMVREIVRRYKLIGGSPLARLTQQQAQALQARLSVPVYVGMRNWHPFVADTVAALPEALQRLVVICLTPHNSRKSIGLYRQQLEAALEQRRTRPVVDFVEDWYAEPLLIQAFAEKIRAMERRRLAGPAAPGTPAFQVPVILTAHSVPESTIADGDPYEAQARETARLVAVAAGLSRWRMAFQSQGMTPEPWIGPTVESQIDELAAQGFRSVMVAPIGFLCDHAEILYDIDIRFREYAAAKGMKLSRPESLNNSPLLIEALASLVRKCSGETEPRGRRGDLAGVAKRRHRRLDGP